MKPYIEVEKDRIDSHKYLNKNTVHRSSLIVPRFDRIKTSITFLNHFLIKRNYKDVVLKITAVDKLGLYLDDLSMDINEPKVYNIQLDEIFDNVKIKNYLIDFYTSKNLFIPYPAVMVNHSGQNFFSVVHAFNRVLNDVFEDDKVNTINAPEAAIDVYSDDTYETFVNFATGQQEINDKLKFEYTNSKENIKKNININLPRFSHKSFLVSDIFEKKLNGGILKILQPKQKMFYGRMFGGVMNNKTKSFTANHSYYCSNHSKEYYETDLCYRTYPYFENFNNELIIYPIMSPGEISFKIKIINDNEVFYSSEKLLISPSGKEIKFDIDDIIKKNGLKNVSAFTLIGNTKDNKLPTRVNHQIIYGNLDRKNKIRGSVNTPLINKKMFTPSGKNKIIWGQVICDNNFVSRLGFVFMDPDGLEDQIKIDIYNEKGFVKNFKLDLYPNKSIQLSSDQIKNKKDQNYDEKSNFYWYLAKSSRQDLTAFSFHYNKISGDGSGEHSF